MAVGYFLDKSLPPSEAQIEMVLADAAPIWKQCLGYIEERFAVPGALHYGGKSYGWHLWYRKSGKALASVYPQAGYFVTQIVLNPEQVECALQLDLGLTAVKILHETPQLRDGRWLFIPVYSETDEADVENLLLIKSPPRKRSAAS
jgi:hypothetical protein